MDDAIYMIRCAVDLPALHEWARSRKMRRQGGFDRGFVMHHLLTETFGDLAPKPFRLTEPQRRGGREAALHGYTSVDVSGLVEASWTFADPLQAKVLPVRSMVSKEMPVEWATGRQLGFESLVRPIVRVAREGSRGKVEIDTYEHLQAQNGDGSNISQPEAYHRWLSTQMEQHGRATLLTSRVHSFEMTRVARQYARQSLPGPSAVMRGVIRVGDPCGFNNLIRRGLGRHRSYGYGLVLLRPAGARG